MNSFPAHGGTSVEVRGRILVFRSQAHLNSEEIRRLQRETTERIRGMAGGRWAILGAMERALLLTADAEVTGREVLPQMIPFGLCALALTFRNPADRPMVEAQVRRVVAGCLPMECFDGEVAALAWLDSIVAQG